MAADIDARVRTAVFEFLARETRAAGTDVLPRTTLATGFEFLGHRVCLIGPQGIFKPAILPEMPISITTVAATEGMDAPYHDVIGSDGLMRYCYRGTDPFHHENVGLRLAKERQVPLVYFHGVVPGRYFAVWPVYVVGESRNDLSFTVNVDDRRLAAADSQDWNTHETQGRRRYITRQVQQRLHQEGFRQKVLAAYRQHCAICRLRHVELLEAAHILPDSHPQGLPIVSNGLALCKLHHAAFDLNIVGIHPDYRVIIRADVLEEVDGPMLEHGLQGFHDTRLWTPGRLDLRPNPAFLEERFAQFKKAS